MFKLNRIGGDRVEFGLPNSTLSPPYLTSFYQCAEHSNSTEHHMVRKSILDMIYASPNPADSSEEIDKYLEMNEECKETNPLEWWKLHEKRFPTLATIARKYLGICATSVPSERLFSDVGNNITNKRINLDSNLVEKMLFLKRNINVLGSIFPPI